ncbi:MAG: hypothetical protein A2288_02205 [Candidatus Moranbacteria bacterium RIFOXYA12_FULL_44_15]|nr:MAG: hypothetical protein A2288_02205 [Candidatus Moranbacteria bacterium RIFOXYA12_FULL_44_15]
MLGWPYLWHISDFAFKKKDTGVWGFIIIAFLFLVPWIWVGEMIYEAPNPKQLELEEEETAILS